MTISFVGHKGRNLSMQCIYTVYCDTLVKEIKEKQLSVKLDLIHADRCIFYRTQYYTYPLRERHREIWTTQY
jgi:hypothetical protein